MKNKILKKIENLDDLCADAIKAVRERNQKYLQVLLKMNDEKEYLITELKFNTSPLIDTCKIM